MQFPVLKKNWGIRDKMVGRSLQKNQTKKTHLNRRVILWEINMEQSYWKQISNSTTAPCLNIVLIFEKKKLK